MKKKNDKAPKTGALMKTLRTIVKPFFWMLYPTKVYCRERFLRGEKAVFVMNHLSASDPVITLMNVSLDIHFLAKKELFDSCFKNWFFTKVNVIGVERGNMSMETMKRVLGVLKADRALGIYPEGTRNKSDEPLLELKEGAALFALMTKSPLVPAAIDCRARIFHKSRILVGEPFELDELYGRKIDKEVLALATARIRAELLKTMDELAERKAAEKRRGKREVAA